MENGIFLLKRRRSRKENTESGFQQTHGSGQRSLTKKNRGFIIQQK